MEVKDETSSISKRQKMHGEGKHVMPNGEGKMGRLPDEILCHILSFMETKDVVQTSVIAKRWRYVWTSVPCIEIMYPMNERNFNNFLDKLLHLNTVSCLRRLRLSWGMDYERLDEWISAALERDIQEVVLNNWGKQCIKLPSRIFSCKKLVDLRLSNRILLDAPLSVYLPSLKVLHLYIAKNLYDQDSMNKLLDGCPVLEELDIKNMEFNNIKKLFVRSSSLKSLSICSTWINEPRIVLDVTNVERLHIIDNGLAQYDIRCISSLVKVNIQVSSSNRLVELLGKLTNTKYLFISSKNMSGLDYQGLDDLPVFHNLTILIVNIHDPTRPVLPYLIECTPNLVTLVYSVTHKARSHEQHLQFKEPKCLMLYLEEIKLSGLKGFADEMEMVRYFLKNSMVLKKLSIKAKLGAKKQLEFTKKHLIFPRGSPECEIIFD